MSESSRSPSRQNLLKAIAVAVALGAALDVGIHYWRTPLGWSPLQVVGLFAIDLLVGLVVAALVGVLIGLPLARSLERKGQFPRFVLAAVGALLGAGTSILFSALGNTYVFMSGPGFWQSLTVDVVIGGLAGHFWWWFEQARRRGRVAA